MAAKGVHSYLDQIKDPGLGHLHGSQPPWTDEGEAEAVT